MNFEIIFLKETPKSAYPSNIVPIINNKQYGIYDVSFKDFHKYANREIFLVKRKSDYFYFTLNQTVKYKEIRYNIKCFEWLTENEITVILEREDKKYLRECSLDEIHNL